MARIHNAQHSTITVTAAVVLLVTSLSYGESPIMNGNNNTGFPVNALFDGSHFDNVQINNGNLHIEIPIETLPGRGGAIPYKFVYDSKGWYFLPNRVLPNHGRIWGEGHLVLSLSGGDTDGYTVSYLHDRIQCDVDSYGHPIYGIHYSGYTLVEPNGTKHPFPGEYGAFEDGGCLYPPTATLLSSDGSGWILNIGGSDLGLIPRTAIRKDGAIVYFDDQGTGGEVSLVDSNGNVLYGTGTDTLGRALPRQICDWSTSPPSCEVDLFDSNGTLQRIRINTVAVAVHTSMCVNPALCTEYITTWEAVPSVITMPNGASYQFQYMQNQYGQPSSVTLPGGGQISWTWGFQDSGGLKVASRTVTVGGQSYTWRYTYDVGNPDLTWTNSINDPLGNQTDFICNGIIVDYDDIPDYASPPCVIIKAKYYQGSSATGTLIKTVTTQYLTSGAVLPTVETTTWNQQNLVSKVETDWDAGPMILGPMGPFRWGNPIERREYDYGTGAPGALIRKTHYDYKHLADQNYRNKNLADLVTATTVYDGSGNTVAQTLNSYDSTTLLPDLGNPTSHDSNYSTSFYTRGNLTQVQKWLNPGSTYITTATNSYDDLGNLRSATDALSHTTTYDYSDSWWGNTACVPAGYNTQAYVRQVTNPLFPAKYNYYYPCTGLVAHTRDANDLAASRNGTIYTYDSVNRVSTMSYTDGGQKTYTYNDTLTGFPMLYVAEQTKLDSSGNTTTEWTGFDGLGRKARRAKLNGEASPNIADMVDTCYNALGRVSTQTYPYQGPGWSQAAICSATAGQSFVYDALGRVKMSIPSDGTLSADGQSCTNCVTNDYSQFPTIKVTDEAGRARQSKSDALGRLLAVWEPDPATGAGFPNETDYTYDTLDNLLRVDQQGNDPSHPANWRTRSFTYDSLSRLLCAGNPETSGGAACPYPDSGTYTPGTTRYAYDNAGNLTSKISPAPNQTGSATLTTCFGSWTGTTCDGTQGYDALNRLLQKTFSSGGAEVFIYDQSSLWGVNTQNSIGRMSGFYNYPSTSSTTVGTASSYDAMGRTTFQRTWNWRSNSASKDFSFIYNLDGSLKAIIYPSSRVVNYGYNQAQRPIWTLDTTSTTYLAGATYTAWGAPSRVNNGNVTTTNYYNTRMQPCRISASTGPAPSSCADSANIGNVLDLKYDFQLGQADNGNVYGITNNKDTSRSQSFTYDYLNRLKQAWTPNSSNWGSSYGYDIWGNLLTKTTMAGYSAGDPPLGVTVDNNNHVSGWCYDAAGNILGQSGCPASTNTYDAENRLTTFSMVLYGANFDYDAEGRRVSKSGTTNTLYWYGPTGEVLEETDNSGTFQHDYVFFGGKRVSRLDAAATNITANVVSTQGVAYNRVAITVSSTQTSYFTVGGRVFVTGLTTSTFLNDRVWPIFAVDTSHPPNITIQVQCFQGVYNLTADTGTVTVGLAAPPIYHYFSDHLGSANVITDANGAVKEESDYYPFGGERVVTDLFIGNTYKFTGKEHDPETGCDYFGARYYCNTIGRFITPDRGSSQPTNPQSLNRYVYALNNPVRYIDPDGNSPRDQHEFFTFLLATVAGRPDTQQLATGASRADNFWNAAGFLSGFGIPNMFGFGWYLNSYMHFGTPPATIGAGIDGGFDAHLVEDNGSKTAPHSVGMLKHIWGDLTGHSPDRADWAGGGFQKFGEMLGMPAGDSIFSALEGTRRFLNHGGLTIIGMMVNGQWRGEGFEGTDLIEVQHYGNWTVYVYRQRQSSRGEAKPGANPAEEDAKRLCGLGNRAACD